jgi:hypothetical protein
MNRELAKKNYQGSKLNTNSLAKKLTGRDFSESTNKSTDFSKTNKLTYLTGEPCRRIGGGTTSEEEGPRRRRKNHVGGGKSRSSEDSAEGGGTTEEEPRRRRRIEFVGGFGRRIVEENRGRRSNRVVVGARNTRLSRRSLPSGRNRGDAEEN